MSIPVITVPIDNWQLTLDAKGMETYLGVEDQINKALIKYVRKARNEHQDYIDLKAFGTDLQKIRIETRQKLISQAFKKRTISFDGTWQNQINMFNTSAKSFKAVDLLKSLLMAMWDDPRSQVFIKAATDFHPERLMYSMNIEEQIKIYLKFYELHHDDFRKQFYK